MCLEKLQEKLLDQKATLMYFRDIPHTDQDFRIVQYMELRGYLPDWDARLHEPVENATLREWRRLSNQPLSDIEAGKTSRLNALRQIYSLVREEAKR